jgi:hypothetical protein
VHQEGDEILTNDRDTAASEQNFSEPIAQRKSVGQFAIMGSRFETTTHYSGSADFEVRTG